MTFTVSGKAASVTVKEQTLRVTDEDTNKPPDGVSIRHTDEVPAESGSADQDGSCIYF